MNHLQKNINELIVFKNSLTKKTNYGQDGFVFEGLVTYHTLNKIESEILEVYLIIGGFEPLIKLDIYSKGIIIISEKYHLDLNPKYDNIIFKFDSPNMIIEGKNSPLIGNYKITIKEHL